MKKPLLLIFSIILSGLLFSQTSIYDIQYTTNIGSDGWSFASDFEGQVVTTGGIVTANNYLGGRYFISSSEGGAWNGIFVYDNTNSPAIGDSILISGTVYEYQGFTEIKDLTSFYVKSTLNPLPQTAKISTVQVADEAYEGVLVELNDCDVSSIYDAEGSWSVDDGSGACAISIGVFNLREYGFPLIVDYTFSQIIGAIGINSGYKKLHPRTIKDFKSEENAFIISTEDKIVDNNFTVELPVKLSILNRAEAINAYSLKIQYDETVFEYSGFSKENTISESGTITDESTVGNIVLNFNGNITCEDTEVLVELIFTPINYGNANLQFAGSTLNGSAISYSLAGVLESASSECDIPIGDTLSIVQRPLLNIPSIVIPNEELNIVCFAPQSTTNWGAELVYENIVVPLNITQSVYNSDLEKWTLTAVIPDVDIYELYDLRVRASDDILDDVSNAIKVIDQYKEDYYFVHLTDTHLPGHTFYQETGYATDNSELDDLYEVIKDINLIRPEFVLLTGDLINEGELEDFECLRNHTLTVELLEKFEVPVYIVPGNHDLGGWDATPPPQGTARQEWWRFFGWRQRETPPTKTEYLTHDYSFDYGNTHFIGLEAYDNYDAYMYDVYGNESFIPSQMTWLNNDIAAAGDKTKVLFYHFDFKGEMNLSTLGVDMALWGHTHKNSDDATHPYNISTASVCDWNRAFRVIRVNGSDLHAENTINTHADGDMLTIDYNMANDGSSNSLSSTVNNKYNLQFENGLLKFIMPQSDMGYIVSNGELIQVHEDGSLATCYVGVTIPANGQVTATIEKNTNETSVENLSSKSFIKHFPNPFRDEMYMEYEIQQASFVNISIYNITGKLVTVLEDAHKNPGKYVVKWNATNAAEIKVKNGIYLYKYSLNGKQISSGQILSVK